MPSYDAIIIGSGAGGLTAAVALAQAGKKVLVLEQHDRPGGWTHSFTLNGYRFSPGVPIEEMKMESSGPAKTRVKPLS